METLENSNVDNTELQSQPDDLVAETLRKNYIAYLLENGKQPGSIFIFAKNLGISEAEFYKHYNSFGILERDVWNRFIIDTEQTLLHDPVFENYSVREKLLAFYYTLVQTLLNNRSYVLLTLQRKQDTLRYFPTELDDFKASFIKWSKDLVSEGLEKGEIVKRPVVSDKYGEALWVQLLFVLNFWAKDDSRNFEKTDAAIEKAINLSMDIMGRNYLDSAFDFAKFLFQNRNM